MDRQAESRWSQLETEQRNERSAELDTLEPTEIVELLIAEDRRGLRRAQEQAAAVAKAATWFAETYRSGGTVLFAGAGTSGRLGVIEAAECPPTFGTEPARVRAVIAGGADAVLRSREGAEDRAEDGRAAGGTLATGDLLIGISASSVTPFVMGALDAARAADARTVLVTCARPAGLADTADLVIALDTGPEILTGSTRLKAGSATKAVLNAMTTAAMVQLGKVHGNLMVDVTPSCAKLEDRALRIVCELGRVSPAEAARLLAQSAQEVKVAVVMARAQLDAAAARRRLQDANGSLRDVLDEARQLDARSES